MNKSICFRLIVCFASMFLGSCSKALEPANPQSSGVVLIPAGELMADQMIYEFAIYYLPRPTKDPFAELDRLLKDKFKGFTKVNEIALPKTGKAIAARLVTDVKKSYTPPDLKSLAHSGRGLDREQAKALQDCKVALVLDFAYSREHVWDGMRKALEITSQLARTTDGLVWDEETREVFTPGEWDKRRIIDWTEKVPSLSKHLTIHAYNTGDHLRAITLGMAKFGLPDIVVENFSWSHNKNIGNLVNLLAQVLAEGGSVQKDGQFDLDLQKIVNSKVRDPQLKSLKPNAKTVALLLLQKGVWEEGDPQNRLIEIRFDRYPGPDVHARQEKMLGSLFGWEDSATYLEHDQEILKASQRAKKKLPALRKAFNAGLDPGEFILVKAPFGTSDDGREWMWIEVISWDGKKIKGLLKNEPFNIPDLHAGQIVEVLETDIFDYIRRYPDGHDEGNETGKIIQKNEEAAKEK